MKRQELLQVLNKEADMLLEKAREAKRKAQAVSNASYTRGKDIGKAEAYIECIDLLHVVIDKILEDKE